MADIADVAQKLERAQIAAALALRRQATLTTGISIATDDARCSMSGLIEDRR